MLATDGESSYTLFLYSDILWSQADFRNVDSSSGSVNSAESGSGGSGNSTGGGGSESDVRSGLIRYIDFGNVRYVALCSHVPGVQNNSVKLYAYQSQSSGEMLFHCFSS